MWLILTGDCTEISRTSSAGMPRRLLSRMRKARTSLLSREAFATPLLSKAAALRVVDAILRRLHAPFGQSILAVGISGRNAQRLNGNGLGQENQELVAVAHAVGRFEIGVRIAVHRHLGAMGRSRRHRRVEQRFYGGRRLFVARTRPTTPANKRLAAVRQEPSRAGTISIKPFLPQGILVHDRRPAIHGDVRRIEIKAATQMFCVPSHVSYEWERGKKFTPSVSDPGITPHVCVAEPALSSGPYPTQPQSGDTQTRRPRRR